MYLLSYIFNPNPQKLTFFSQQKNIKINIIKNKYLDYKLFGQINTYIEIKILNSSYFIYVEKDIYFFNKDFELYLL